MRPISDPLDHIYIRLKYRLVDTKKCDHSFYSQNRSLVLNKTLLKCVYYCVMKKSTKYNARINNSLPRNILEITNYFMVTILN